jgi:riboflavin kinase/FMN adenylyltransferase
LIIAVGMKEIKDEGYNEKNICGIVIRGRQVGRQLGFPTANIDSANGKYYKDGVYIVEVEVNGQTKRGIMSMGSRPTFGVQKRGIEVHIFDFDTDIYGCFITIRPLQFLRENYTFSNIHLLVNQIQRDKTEAESFFASTGQ